ncbi:AbiH family protein [Saccharicrinis sp. FJH62]|uniref:AbiH family protein n=1 Tax=Saccharicrinis sp. FJH62 TaxID=3344657 RepID=UPI0035D43E8E
MTALLTHAPEYETFGINNSIFNQYKEVNKLIIVGNGFDLAHGLNSSFKDFISDYILNVIKEFLKERIYDDSLIQISSKSDLFHITDIVSKLNKDNSIESLFKIKARSNINFHFKFELLKSIIDNFQYKNWYDIEVIFFDLLADLVSNKEFSQISSLNEELEFLKSKLIEYLLKQENISKCIIHEGLLNQFKSLIKKQDCLINTIEEDLVAKSFYFLNFNYTNILQKYVDEMGDFFSTINYIHGAINAELANGQSPIFGFGDEFDKKYEKFEEENEDEAFVHIKSFKYLESNNYRNLMEFIESNAFQVQIFGHSCGISDRTMLNKIFEHENCISIKVYYHNVGDSNDYTKKNYSISRHFKDKSMLRNKVVNFKYCEPMIQPI